MRRLATAFLLAAAGTAFGPSARADDGEIGPTRTASIDAARVFPPGDYRLKWTDSCDRMAISQVDPMKAQAVHARSLDEGDARELVKNLGKLMNGRLPTLLPSLTALRSYEENQELLLRSLENWRLISDDANGTDEYYLDGRVAQSFRRTKEGYRPVFFIRPIMTLYLGPAGVVDQLRLFERLTSAVAPDADSTARRVKWHVDVSTLSSDDYFGLRIPLTYEGISKGRVDFTAEPDVVSVLISDGDGGPVGSREYRLVEGRFDGFTEKKWFPGDLMSYETVRCEVLSFEAKTAADELYPAGYFEKAHVIDARLGKDHSRAVRIEHGGIPTDAEFDRLHAEYVHPDTHLRDWAIVAAGALLVGVAVWRRRR